MDNLFSYKLIIGLVFKILLRDFGAYAVLVSILTYLVTPLYLRNSIINKITLKYDKVTLIISSIFVVVAFSYIFYPNYMDHGEATIASLGGIFNRGEVIYPIPNTYPYHGLLYGPILSEIQAIVRWLNFTPILGSKIPGFLLFSTALIIMWKITHKSLAKGYLLFLFPFGGFALFANRSDTYFLMLVALTLKIGNDVINEKIFFKKKYIPLVFGIFAGVASALKLHGAAYVFAAYLAISITSGISLLALFGFATSAFLGFIIFFIPDNVSLIGFLHYIQLAGKHGLSFKQFFENLVYLSILVMPLIMVKNAVKPENNYKFVLYLILGLEFIIGFISAKPGAGPWHLAPFIFVNAYLIEILILKNSEIREDFIKITYAVLTVVALVTILLFVRAELTSWSKYRDAQRELIDFENKYPNLKMGLTGNADFQITFLRVVLKTTQIDYTGFMDLQFSGITDETFVKKISHCTDSYFVLPAEGVPFSLSSFYTNDFMFSDELRKAFKNKYKLIETKKYFSIYACT